MKKVGAPRGNKNTLGKHWKIKDTSKMKGRIPWNKGVPMSPEAKEKMVAKKIGKPSGRKGLKVQTNSGRTHFKKGVVPWNKNKECPHYSGENHWNWRGGRTKAASKRVNTLEWRALRLKVYERDSWTCQDCWKKCDHDIQAHHVTPYEDGGSDVLSNLVTLCKACHLRRHHILRAKAA